ncbi:MAG: hypothetical protein RLZZ450_2955 [Pseudomonadota bacterium]
MPQASPAFRDLYNVTSALDCARAGFDPLRNNPCDFGARPMNYPRIWLALTALDIGVRDTTAIGIGLGVALIGATMFWVGRLRAREGALLALLMCSPCFMLLVERGNVDGVVLMLLMGSTALLARGRVARRLGTLIMLLAAMLKLFPAFALPLVALRPRPHRSTLALPIVACLGFVAYCWLTLDDLALIQKTVPQSGYVSYGAPAIALSALGSAEGGPSRVVYLVTVLLIALVGARAAPALQAPRLALDSRASLGFLTGTAVYLGTFALGTNWAYRLSFLVLLAPQCFFWCRETGAARRYAIVLYGLLIAISYGVMFSLLFPRLPHDLHMAVQIGVHILTWALALGLGAVLPGQVVDALRQSPEPACASA